MDEKQKALKLIKMLRESSYNHSFCGTDMTVDEETAVGLVEDVFGVEEPMD